MKRDYSLSIIFLYFKFFLLVSAALVTLSGVVVVINGFSEWIYFANISFGLVIGYLIVSHVQETHEQRMIAKALEVFFESGGEEKEVVTSMKRHSKNFLTVGTEKKTVHYVVEFSKKGVLFVEMPEEVLVKGILVNLDQEIVDQNLSISNLTGLRKVEVVSKEEVSKEE